MNNWISIHDKLPELTLNNGICSETVLVYIRTNSRLNDTDDAINLAYYTEVGWCYSWGDLMDDDDIKALSHWQPLPSPPKQ